jgi:hypothetical protein
MNNFNDLKINYEELKKKCDDHASKCNRITKEIEKWGQKNKMKLEFLKNTK